MYAITFTLLRRIMPFSLKDNYTPKGVDNCIIMLQGNFHDLGLISKIGYFMRLHNLGYDFVKRLLHRK